MLPNAKIKNYRYTTTLIWPVLLLVVSHNAPAYAYIGPGAGFAFVSTFSIFFATIFFAILTIATWPIRWILKIILRRKKCGPARAKRVIVIGLDGLDADLTEKYIHDGLLPNFARLRSQGGYSRLNTTLPAESPVAWSSFQTGCNPGKHRIYDFITPNRKSMLPELSSSSITASARTINIGKYKIPIGKPRITAGRKSQPFWKILGEHGVFSNIIRVPITFPPEKFNGLLLSAMCLPDLRGSQGTFFYLTSDPNEKRRFTSGIQLTLNPGGSGHDTIFNATIPGPENTLIRKGCEMKTSIEIRLNNVGPKRQATLVASGKSYALCQGQYSSWVNLIFRPGLGIKIHGLFRAVLLETTPHVKLYMTPLQIDPERPALPISHPFRYCVYLAKSLGPFATLGIAEDTSALNEKVISEETFLAHCDLVHKEREAMLFDALDKTRHGLVACVFDIPDRVQHMFMRYLEDTKSSQYGRVISNMYMQMDNLAGRVMERVDNDTVLMVMSDHGVKPFQRGVDLNAWLKHNGYLHLKERLPERDKQDMLQEINWSKTRAYAVGFGGIYLNLAGREAFGIVKPGETAELLKQEITARLITLRDDEKGQSPIKQVYDGANVYKGPYSSEAPDLFVGMNIGYRVAWYAVTGGVGDNIFEDNVNAWSGDHNMDPSCVPAILFTNRPVNNTTPHITDIAPTVLELFGVPVPGYMDGKPLMTEQPL